MNASRLLRVAILGLVTSGFAACGGAVKGDQGPSPAPTGHSGPVCPCSPDDQDCACPDFDAGPRGMRPPHPADASTCSSQPEIGCGGGEGPGVSCSSTVECVDGSWTCNTVCIDAGPPSCTGELPVCASNTDGCTGTPFCSEGVWQCITACDAGPPTCVCSSTSPECCADSGLLDSGPVCPCPPDDKDCGCDVDAGAADAGCGCPANDPSCACVISG